MSEQPQDGTTQESKQRTAANQLGGPNEAQLYYDTVLAEPIILTQHDGWKATDSRDYMDRTWRVQRPRDWIASPGNEHEVIKQTTKLGRVDSDRYQTVSDKTVDQVLDTATEKNREWMAVEQPHIPYDGEGGINIYLGGERLSHKRIESENQVFVKDGWSDFEIGVRMNYGTVDQFLEVEIGGETVPYSRITDGESIDEDQIYEPDGDHNGPTVMVQRNTECEQYGETSYDIPEIDGDN